MKQRVCLAGATGWAGSALARAIVQSDDLELVAGVSRRHAGERLGQVLGISDLDTPLYATANAALDTTCDVFFEYTRPEIAKDNASAAIARGAHVVIGTSGLADNDLDDLGRLASDHCVGVLAVGNFSIVATVLAKCAQLAVKHMPQWEIVDYASAEKPDAPSGTARELTIKLAEIRRPQITVPIESTQGSIESRGATVNGMQVHSVRLPGHVIGVEVLLGVLDEKLAIRYDAGSSAEPYVAGALLAIRRVSSFVGLKRGMDSIMEL